MNGPKSVSFLNSPAPRLVLAMWPRTEENLEPMCGPNVMLSLVVETGGEASVV
jgi:hypothetical protein